MLDQDKETILEYICLIPWNYVAVSGCSDSYCAVLLLSRSEVLHGIMPASLTHVTVP
jgi:hypothetical protein